MGVAKGRLARTILSGPPQQPRCSGLKLEPPSAKGDLLVTSPLVPTRASGSCEDAGARPLVQRAMTAKRSVAIEIVAAGCSCTQDAKRETLNRT
ncbi:hypothetical protein G5I_09632 [Acromyrmex echinatior]|uniref:Uncharacterized protein n=1 Tax=Acromyrmex echinatior TaxID=103372 RepID=F4WUQ5_ACREC|nr:hypothetical protein G5I_09632 [Acromyrmex echinatior]